MGQKSIGIIGAGDIGFNLAEILALQGYDIIIHNRYHEVDGKPSPYWNSKMGKVMDMNDSLQLPGSGEVRLSPNLEDLDGTFANVITAGAKRTHVDETREELARKNAAIIRTYAPLVARNPESLFLIVSNPVDSLTQCLIDAACALSDRPKDEIARRVVGVSYIDTMRLKNLVKEFLKEQDIKLVRPVIGGIALGEHGPTMVPLLSHVTINGKPLSDFANREQADAIAKQTILRGNDIIKLTGASSVVGPAHAVMHMILSITNNERVQLPCSVWDGKRCIGKLAEFVNGRVERIAEVAMTPAEAEQLKRSEIALEKQYVDIKSGS